MKKSEYCPQKTANETTENKKTTGKLPKGKAQNVSKAKERAKGKMFQKQREKSKGKKQYKKGKKTAVETNRH